MARCDGGVVSSVSIFNQVCRSARRRRGSVGIEAKPHEPLDARSARPRTLRTTLPAASLSVALRVVLIRRETI